MHNKIPDKCNLRWWIKCGFIWPHSCTFSSAFCSALRVPSFEISLIFVLLSHFVTLLSQLCCASLSHQSGNWILPPSGSEISFTLSLLCSGCLIICLGWRSVFKELIFCCWQNKEKVKEGSECGSVLNKLWRSQRILIWLEKETCIQQHIFVCNSLNGQLWLLWEFGVDCMTGINWISLVTRT